LESFGIKLERARYQGTGKTPPQYGARWRAIYFQLQLFKLHCFCYHLNIGDFNMQGEFGYNMTDEEFLEFVEECAEFDKTCGWDTTKYLLPFQDPNYIPPPETLFSIGDIAQKLGVAEQTVDQWLKKGAPVYREGSRGVPYQLEIGAIYNWRLAQKAGITLDEQYAILLKEAEASEIRFQARLRRIQNQQLAARVETLTKQVSTLKRNAAPRRKANASGG
jgi:DNA-binding transcriptional MerR regulator